MWSMRIRNVSLEHLWKKEHELTFIRLKRSVVGMMETAFPSGEQGFSLFTDASDVGFGAVLVHVRLKNGWEVRPLSFQKWLVLGISVSVRKRPLRSWMQLRTALSSSDLTLSASDYDGSPQFGVHFKSLGSCFQQDSLGSAGALGYSYATV